MPKQSEEAENATAKPHQQPLKKRSERWLDNPVRNCLLRIQLYEDVYQFFRAVQGRERVGLLDYFVVEGDLYDYYM